MAAIRLLIHLLTFVKRMKAFITRWLPQPAKRFEMKGHEHISKMELTALLVMQKSYRCSPQ